MAALQGLVALTSKYNDKYLRYIHEVQVHGFLQSSGDKVMSPYTKYEVEKAKCGNGNLVHIRCCYNNKYWVRWSTNQKWIVAGADKPQEDTTLWSCTLFQLEPDGDHPLTFRLRHVQLNNYVRPSQLEPPFNLCLFAGQQSPDNNSSEVFTVVHLESLMFLPKRIALKADNNKYLSARAYPDLQFASDNIGDPTVRFEVVTSSDGSVRIKSDYTGKFWQLDQRTNWIQLDSEDTTNKDLDLQFFFPVKPKKIENIIENVEKNVVALKNLSNKMYCRRVTEDGKTDCLRATLPTPPTSPPPLPKEARFQVYEIAISRNVDNVKFQLMDARIYSLQRDITMATGDAINRSQVPITVDLKLSYTETRTQTWSSSVWLKLGVKTSIIKTGIPLIWEGKIKIFDEFSGDCHWGETVSSTKTVETEYKVTVQPMTKVRVSLRATKGSCDVPFSYSQQDTLTDGQEVPYDDMDDGIYTGINCFDFMYDTEEWKL